MTVEELAREMRTGFSRVEGAIQANREEARDDTNKLWDAHTKLSEKSAAGLKELTKDTADALTRHHGQIEGLKVRIGVFATMSAGIAVALNWVTNKLSGN